MYRNIVVGFDASERARDALALAGKLRADDGVVTALYVTPDPKLPFGADWSSAVEDDAAETLAHARQHMSAASWLRHESLASSSVPRGLQHFAEEHGADLLVVGSSHRGHAGRLFAGTTAQTLLNGAPCPVAVATFGCDERPLRTIGLAFDGSREACTALDAAMAVAEGTDATVRLICVVPTIETWTGGVGWYRDLTTQERVGYRAFELERMLENASTRLPEGLRDRVTVLEGPAGVALVRESHKLDLLVMGSRGYGPIRRVLLGSVAGAVVREAACPVLVTPRNVETERYISPSRLETPCSTS